MLYVVDGRVIIVLDLAELEEARFMEVLAFLHQLCIRGGVKNDLLLTRLRGFVDKEVDCDVALGRLEEYRHGGCLIWRTERGWSEVKARCREMDQRHWEC